MKIIFFKKDLGKNYCQWSYRRTYNRCCPGGPWVGIWIVESMHTNIVEIILDFRKWKTVLNSILLRVVTCNRLSILSFLVPNSTLVGHGSLMYFLMLLCLIDFGVVVVLVSFSCRNSHCIGLNLDLFGFC